MSADRDQYREIYPQIIEVPEFAFQEYIDNASTLEEKQHFSCLLEDIKNIRSSTKITSWPDDNLCSEIKIITSKIAKIIFLSAIDIDELQETFKKELGGNRKDRVNIAKRYTKVLTSNEISLYKSAGIDFKKMFIEIPKQRVLRVNNLHNPFSLIDRNLSTIEFPMFQDLLDETHASIVRGHGWFGVGHWNVASHNYMVALAKALATNNFVAVESIARFLVDTYTAAGDTYSAENLVIDYFQSSAYDAETYSKVPTEMVESMCVAFALSNKWSESIQWIEKMPSVSKNKINQEVETWRIIELLQDVYQYKNDSANMSRLNKVLKALAGHL